MNYHVPCFRISENNEEFFPLIHNTRKIVEKYICLDVNISDNPYHYLIVCALHLIENLMIIAILPISVKLFSAYALPFLKLLHFFKNIFNESLIYSHSYHDTYKALIS